MASFARVCALVALAGTLGAALPAPAAEPVAKASPLVSPAKPTTCGELPRASRAYKTCIGAQSRRDAPAAGQPAVKPVFSSR